MSSAEMSGAGFPLNLDDQQSSQHRSVRKTTFNYESLATREIRVLEILPSRPRHSDDTIHVSMRTIPLDHPGNYYTLSYAWGDVSSDGSHLDRTIKVDGNPIPITQNLHTALHRIRDIWDAFFDDSGALRPEVIFEQPMDHWVHNSMFSRFSTDNEIMSLTRPPIWVDALCINQGDHRELNAQVRIMGDIYKNSTYLLVWLGEPFSNFDAETRSDEQVVETLLSSPWFQRRWVVQEVFHKRKKISILLKGWLYDRAKFHLELTTTYPYLRPQAGPLDYTFGRAVERDPLHNLHRYSRTQCSDPLDRVYALLGISTDGENIPIDYDLSALEVYLKVAVFYAQIGSVTRLLAHAASRNQARQREAVDQDPWPSWVPDWRYCSFPGTSDDEWMTHPSLLAERRTEREGARNFPPVYAYQFCGMTHCLLELEVCILETFDVDRHESEDCWPCERPCDINELDDTDLDDPLFRRFCSVYRPCPQCRLHTAYEYMKDRGIACFLPGSSCLFSFTPNIRRNSSLYNEYRLDCCWDDVIRWDGRRPVAFNITDESWLMPLDGDSTRWRVINVV